MLRWPVNKLGPQSLRGQVEARQERRCEAVEGAGSQGRAHTAAPGATASHYYSISLDAGAPAAPAADADAVHDFLQPHTDAIVPELLAGLQAAPCHEPDSDGHHYEQHANGEQPPPNLLCERCALSHSVLLLPLM